ncbi:Hpt domain-containing protein [Pseudoalteromonas sp. SS15]|uniref:Hpt domain-containing protein n=1 Tax=Pseudoalteromonas sp. SS15 TaxID=3139393 RepID=UPI003BAD946F
MFNPNTIQQLKDDVGVDVLAQLMQVFLTESTKLVEQLSANSVEQNEIERLAHSLKSCARSYGADQLADIAADIETTAKSSPELVNIESKISLLSEVHKKTLNSIPKLD